MTLPGAAGAPCTESAGPPELSIACDTRIKPSGRAAPSGYRPSFIGLERGVYTTGQRDDPHEAKDHGREEHTLHTGAKPEANIPSK